MKKRSCCKNFLLYILSFTFSGMMVCAAANEENQKDASPNSRGYKTRSTRTARNTLGGLTDINRHNPHPSLRMVTNKPTKLTGSLFRRGHFPKVEELIRPHFFSVYAEKKYKESNTTCAVLYRTRQPFDIYSARTSLSINDHPQNVFLVIRSKAGGLYYPLLHYSNDYSVMNFEGKLLYEGTFKNIENLVTSLQNPQTLASTSLPSEIISDIRVNRIYAKSGKPHAIALIKTHYNDEHTSNYWLDIDLKTSRAINIPAPPGFTFADVYVRSAYDRRNMWVSAESDRMLHVLGLDTDSLTFPSHHPIDVQVPRLRPDGHADYLCVIMRDEKPAYLEKSSEDAIFVNRLNGHTNSKPLIVDESLFLGQDLNGRVITLKTSQESDISVPVATDLETGTISNALTPEQTNKVGRDIKGIFWLNELLPEFPEVSLVGDGALVVTTEAAPKRVSFIFGNNIDHPFKKKQIDRLSLWGISRRSPISHKRTAFSPSLDASVFISKSAGSVLNSSIQLHKKDGTSITYSIALDAPISPVYFCAFRTSYLKSLPGIYLSGRSDTGIIFLHIQGGPHGKKSVDKFHLLSQYLASFGDVFDVNYPGSTGLGRTFEDYSNGNWSGVADLLAEIARELGRGSKKVVAVGTSFGAYATMKIANQYPDLLKGAIAICGIYDLSQGLEEISKREGLEEKSKNKAIENSRHQFGGTGRDENVRRNSVIFGSTPHASVTCPTLLVSGGKDQQCFPAQTEKMFKALKLCPKAYHLHSKNMYHSPSAPENAIIASFIGPFLHACVSNRVIFEPFPEAISRLAAYGNDLGLCGLPGWSLRSHPPGSREMLNAELTALGIPF